MKFLVRVSVDLPRMAEFGQKLQMGELDRSCIRGDTVCVREDPAVGYSIWEAGSREEFDAKFEPWSRFYKEVEIREVISPNESMKLLFEKMKGS